jgi:hypothetical protein
MLGQRGTDFRDVVRHAGTVLHQQPGIRSSGRAARGAVAAHLRAWLTRWHAIGPPAAGVTR